jgi:hypothetical protein
LSSIAETGKMRQSSKKHDCPKYRVNLFVPKRYFTYFYVIGTYLSISVLVIEAAYSYASISSFYGIFPLSLFLIQCSKRSVLISAICISYSLKLQVVGMFIYHRLR